MSLEVEADEESGVSPLTPLRRLVTSRSGDQVELRELHVARNVHPSACGPVIRNVLGSVAN